MMSASENYSHQPKGVKKGGNPGVQEIIYIMCLTPDGRILMLRRGFKSGNNMFVGPWSVTMIKKIHYGYEVEKPLEAVRDVVSTNLEITEEYMKNNVIISHADSFMRNRNNFYYVYIVELNKRIKLVFEATAEARAIEERTLSKLLNKTPDIFSYDTQVMLIDRFGFNQVYG